MRRTLFFVFCLLAVSGCANAPSGGQDTVKFISSPEGATMTTSLGASCVTPCEMRITRDQSFTATFTKPGFSSASVDVGTKILDYNTTYDVGPLSIGYSSQTIISDDRGLYNTVHTPNPVSVELVAN